MQNQQFIMEKSWENRQKNILGPFVGPKFFSANFVAPVVKHYGNELELENSWENHRKPHFGPISDRNFFLQKSENITFLGGCLPPAEI